MVNASTLDNRYKVGGSLRFNHPSYVTRQADRELLTALNAHQLCYVFNCRQMGKSSLRVRAMHQLRAQGKVCAAIDMTSLGSNVSPRQWYSGIITQLWQGFNLSESVNLKAWLRDRVDLSAPQQLGEFIAEVLLVHCAKHQIYIFIDEIDKVLSLGFPLDDFFGLIRFCYNQRAENPHYNRLSFALFGVATPSDLIQNRTQTSFNIGQAIELTGFTLEEVQPLERGLTSLTHSPQQVLRTILDWTGGQPFLTQKLCQLIATHPASISPGQEAAVVEQWVRQRMLRNWESQDEPIHLKTIRDRLLSHPRRTAQLLGLYRQIWQQGTIGADNSPEQSELQLTGLVVKQQGQLRVYNRIYRAIFNLDWIDHELAKLRPYSEALTAWEDSQRQDESRLLRGKALGEALIWAEHNHLSSQDYQFLAASQALDKQIALADLQRVREVERLETQLQSAQRAKEAERRARKELTTAYQEAQRKLRIGTAVLVASLLGSAIAAIWVGYAVKRQQDAQVQALDWAGKSALKQFEFRQIEALLTAMEAAQDLEKLAPANQLLQENPTTSPLVALDEILSNIQERNRLEGHEAAINSVHFSPDGTTLATASRDGTARLWDRQGNLKHVLKGHREDVYSVSFSPDGSTLATASRDGTAKLWDRQGTLRQTLEGHRTDVYTASFSPDGQTLATASRDGTVRLWTLNGRELMRLNAHPDSVYSVQFNPTGEQLATASRDGVVRLWNRQGQLLTTLRGHRRAVYSISFHPDGQRLATASSDGTVRLWNQQGEVLTTLRGHRDEINDVSFSPDGITLVTASGDKTVRLWDLQGNLLATLRGHRGAVYTASFSPDGKTLATAANEDAIAHLWDLTSELKVQQGSEAMPHVITSRSFSPTGDRLVTAFENGKIRVQPLQGEKHLEFQAREGMINSVGWSPDGQTLVTASKQGMIRLWTLAGEQLQAFKGHQDTIYSARFSPDGQLIATTSRDERVKIWNLRGEEQRALRGYRGVVYAINFSPDGRRLGMAVENGTVKLWDLHRQTLTLFRGHQGAIHDLQFSPEGESFATASGDGTVKLWDLQGNLQQQYRHESDLVYRVQFSQEGRLLATGAKDGTVRVWTRQGALRSTYKGHQGLVDAIGFSSEGLLLTSTRTELNPRVWPIDVTHQSRSKQLLKRGCDWLRDYFVSHPQDALAVCSDGAEK